MWPKLENAVKEKHKKCSNLVQKSCQVMLKSSWAIRGCECTELSDCRYYQWSVSLYRLYFTHLPLTTLIICQFFKRFCRKFSKVAVWSFICFDFTTEFKGQWHNSCHFFYPSLEILRQNYQIDGKGNQVL